MNGRLFTIDEANALLPTLIPLMERLLEARERIAAVGADLLHVLEQSSGNGGSLSASKAVGDIAVIQEIVAEISALGCELKDLTTGLIDFPAERDGREVYLCWRYGEDKVEWWHDMDAGFAGRQPL
jgi:hypothetical protein